ncbi:MAG: hypothetical protein ACLFPV_01915 [Spirochaetaceae bacterium]
MTISRILPIALTGSTPEGGWTYDLVKAALSLVRPHLIGDPVCT